MPINVGEWVKSRIIRIFPAYWIVTIGAFVLTLLLGGKNISWGLFVSQMLGLGYFTHGWELVNVVSWYLSLLMLCYLLFLISGWMKHPSYFNILLISVCLVLVMTRTEVDLSRHISSFFLGGMLTWSASRKYVVLATVLLFCSGLGYDHQLFYAGFSVLVLGVFVFVNKKDQLLFRISSKYSYEYFLLHGIFLAGCIRVFPEEMIAIPLAIVLSMISAVILNRFLSPDMILRNVG